MVGLIQESFPNFSGLPKNLVEAFDLEFKLKSMILLR